MKTLIKTLLEENQASRQQRQPLVSHDQKLDRRKLRRHQVSCHQRQPPSAIKIHDKIDFGGDQGMLLTATTHFHSEIFKEGSVDTFTYPLG